MSNIRDLDGPLRFGDPKQIAAVKAFEAGAVTCFGCEGLFDPDPDANELRDGWCQDCTNIRMCHRCGDMTWGEPLDEQLCDECRRGFSPTGNLPAERVDRGLEVNDG